MALTQAGRDPASDSRKRLRDKNSDSGTRRKADARRAEAAVPGPHPQPPAGAVRLGPTPGNASCHPLATAPSPAPPPLTSSSGVRLSRSPQQQHHRQQQHTDPLHPAIFLLSCHSGPPQPAPPLPPRICASRDWPRGVTWPSGASGRETGSGCRRVGRELASHDAVLGRLPGSSPGAAMLGAGLPVTTAFDGFRLPLVLLPLATGSRAPPPPQVLGRCSRNRRGSDWTVSGSEAWDAVEEFAESRMCQLATHRWRGLLVGGQLGAGPSCLCT